jgi:hypothetical protein
LRDRFSEVVVLTRVSIARARVGLTLALALRLGGAVGFLLGLLFTLRVPLHCVRTPRSRVSALLCLVRRVLRRQPRRQTLPARFLPLPLFPARHF